MILYIASFGIGCLIVLLAFSYLIRECCIMHKRPARKAELKRLVDLICKRGGCGYADVHLKSCMHLLDHYGLTLEEAGFEGDFDALCIKADAGFKAYVDSFHRLFAETWSYEGEPDELGLILPTTQGWDGFSSVQVYRRSLRKLRKLERRQEDFLSNARALYGGRAFLLRQPHFSAKILFYEETYRRQRHHSRE